MPAAPLPSNETQRLKALRALQLLDTKPEERFDRITRLASRLLNVPIVHVALIDENRQFLKSHFGTDTIETPRDQAFCAYTILENKQLVVPDAQSDPRFMENPLVTGKPFIRFYVGHPLAAPDGSLVGTLCVIDRKPRIPSDEDLLALRDLAQLVQSELNLAEVATAFATKRQTEEKLRLSEARFREVVDIPGRFVWESTLEGKTLFISDRVQEVLGYSPEDMKLRGFFEGVVPEDAVMASAKFYYAAQKAQRFSDLEFRSETREGRIIWLSARGAPMLDDRGKLTGYRGTCTDITERKEIQQEVIAAKEAAESANRAKSDFLANMSHEIRTPMNAIVGMTGLLLGADLNPEQRTYAQTIRHSADALLTIISDILDFSKIESGKLELESHPFDLSLLIEEAVDYVAIQASEKNIELHWTIAADLPPGFEGDVTRLRQILVNLLSNAVRFTREGDVGVTVGRAETEGTGDHFVLFSVWDTGIGIPADKVDHLFQSFSQVDTSTTRKFGGTGLGLAISRKLTEMMGGRIWVHSKVGEGSAFHVAVPLKEALPPKPLVPNPILRGKTLYIVAAHPDIREMIESFAVNWGMKAELMGTGAEAIKKLRGGGVCHAAVIEESLPDQSGKDLLQEMQRQRGTATVPCVLLCSLQQQAAYGASIPPGFVACLSKPVHFHQLHGILATSLKGEKVTNKLLRSTGRIDPGFSQRRPMKILLAEDNVINQKVATRILGQMGYRTDVAQNGLEVMEALERQKYDVILMDVQMPEMDGLEATRQIRARWTVKRPWIIAMTANAMDSDRQMCMAAGMDGYLSKPVRIEALENELIRSSDSIGQVVDFSVLSRFGEMTGSGSEAVRELVDIFAEETPHILQQIRENIENRNIQGVGVQALQLGRAASNFGAERMQLLCSSLQTAGKNGDFGLATEFMERLEQEFETVKATLEEFANAPSGQES